MRDTPVLKHSKKSEYVCISLEAISWPHLHPELELVTPSDLTSEMWNWQRDRETTVKAQGLLASLQKPEFIMAFVVVKNCLQLLRGMTTELQKRDIDIVSAYNVIDDTTKKITDLGANSNINREHADWYNEAQQIGKESGGRYHHARYQHKERLLGQRGMYFY